MATQRAVLADGCFRGVQDLVWRQPGVVSTRVGYTDGAIANPTYRNHPDRQGNDRGSSYRSAIFTVDDEQRRTALDTIADVDASRLWPGPVVTEVTPASRFWEAEPEHQDYLERYPGGCTCHFARPGWRLPVRTQTPA